MKQNVRPLCVLSDSRKISVHLSNGRHMHSASNAGLCNIRKMHATHIHKGKKLVNLKF